MELIEVEPLGPLARDAMSRYYAEIDARFPEGFDPGDPPPLELFLAAAHPDDATRAVAGGGLQRIAPGIDEVKRMWVDPEVRGAGLGRRLLTAIEDAARARGSDVVRLDTHRALTEAIAFYDRAGYRRIERYNDNPYAQLFFEKLTTPAR